MTPLALGDIILIFSIGFGTMFIVNSEKIKQFVKKLARR